MRRLLFLVGLALANDPSPTAADVLSQSIEGKSVHEFRGFYKREHSLMRPYSGRFFHILPYFLLLDIPYWNVQGNTMVSSQQVRLTTDEQSKIGAIWNVQVIFTFFPV